MKAVTELKVTGALCSVRVNPRRKSRAQRLAALAKGQARRASNGSIKLITADSRILPLRCIQALDAEGKVRGKTWRDMAGGHYGTEEIKALSWWLWKRGLASEGKLCRRRLSADERAERDAMKAMGAEEAAMDA
jgi:hypothetical protein